MMRRGLQIGLLGTLLGVVAWWYGTLQANERPQSPVKRDLAVVDSRRLFMEHPRFQEKREELRRRFEIAEESLKGPADQLRAMEERLKRLDPSTADFRDLRQQFATASAELQQKKVEIQRSFFREESELYQATYRNVRAEVRHFAEEHGIKLVLRFSPDMDDEPGKSDPQKIMEKLQAQVLYHDGLDITDDILAGLR